jgi:hypothetical protein
MMVTTRRIFAVLFWVAVLVTMYFQDARERQNLCIAAAGAVSIDQSLEWQTDRILAGMQVSVLFLSGMACWLIPGLTYPKGASN